MRSRFAFLAGSSTLFMIYKQGYYIVIEKSTIDLQMGCTPVNNGTDKFLTNTRYFFISGLLILYFSVSRSPSSGRHVFLILVDKLF